MKMGIEWDFMTSHVGPKEDKNMRPFEAAIEAARNRLECTTLFFIDGPYDKEVPIGDDGEGIIDYIPEAIEDAFRAAIEALDRQETHPYRRVAFGHFKLALLRLFGVEE
jgi:hypothetical protein